MALYAIVEYVFVASRTPCPLAGTVGMVDENVDLTAEYIPVTFKLPFQCSDNQIWLPHDGQDTMTVKFKVDEIRFFRG